MIKILSGLSIPVGSTVALVNLCNQFNKRGHECVLYGPDRWHLDQCRSADVADFHPEMGDIIIVHNIRLFSLHELYKMGDKIQELRRRTWFSPLQDMIRKGMPGARKHDGIKLILTCQATDLFPLNRLNLALFDKIHYADFSQLRYHKIARDYFICPNFSDPLTPSKEKPDRIAGVIGSIRKENKIEFSLERAFQEGLERVVLYGYMSDPIYYYGFLEPLTKKYPGKISYAGFVNDRQKIYDSLSDVYCTVEKPWSLVQKECLLTNTRYHGPDPDPGESRTDDRLFALWQDQLGL
ncbi:MAG: hypothetical protein L7F78_00795 [Syntrophales bacterium LBB04]|nr:hypothetical protein [Syntrophales bacterium LBB04]